MAGGKHKYYTVEELTKIWDDYKVFLLEEAKKWPKVQYVGKDGLRKVDYPVMPYTLEGFKVFCRSKKSEVQHYFDNPKGAYDEFRAICSHIREEIRAQQITGGLLGVYNPSITQRLNNLKESTDTTIHTEQPIFGDNDDDKD